MLIAAGAILLDLGPAGATGALLVTAGSLVVLAMFVVVWRRQPALYVVTMALGALAWVVGNALWLDGASIYRLVFWWMAFLVLTIAGERLELNRVLRPTPAVRAWFVAGMVLTLAGVALERWRPEPGLRTLGAGLLVLAWWLARHDVARRTVRQRGLTRFMAVCLLAGYVWLGAGGILALTVPATTPGTVYDATLHAVFLGFVMSMVFAHAPVIFPAILGVPLGYRPAFYVHLGLLHLSVTVRVIGDLIDVLGRWRVWGGLFNAVALLLFLFNTGWSIARARRPPAPSAPGTAETASTAS